MLKRVHFKNWRSLRDVVLDDLGPITVLIGANSSGKTNIVEAFEFLHDFARNVATREALFFQIEREQVPSLNLSPEAYLEIAVDFLHDTSSTELSYRLCVFRNGLREELASGRGRMLENNISIEYEKLEKVLRTYDVASQLYAWAVKHETSNPEISDFWRTLSGRMQILAEQFAPISTIFQESATNVFPMSADASDLLRTLEFLQSRYPMIYADLQSDFAWLMGHVSRIETVRNDRESRLLVFERVHQDQAAPTISSGTLRSLALITAFYGLEMNSAELPGLVVVDEPDVSLNPGILGKLVELLRNYTSREGRPRQIILTTHNPAFLNYFQPDEVRIVSRDEQGYTQVERVPERVKKVWLEDGEYSLGEIWDMGAFGVPVE